MVRYVNSLHLISINIPFFLLKLYKSYGSFIKKSLVNIIGNFKMMIDYIRFIYYYNINTYNGGAMWVI